MSFLDELVPGFVGRQRYVEERNRQDDIQSRDKEGKIYEALLNSSDPHVQSMALSGLFESALPGKKAGGLKGWMGERQKSPLYQQLQQYISTPVQETSSTPGPRSPELPIERSLPGKVEGPIGTPQATVTALPPPAPSAQSATSPVQGGPPPVTTGTQTATGSQPVVSGQSGVFPRSQPAVAPPGLQGPPSPSFVTGSHPRQIFDTAEEATRKKYTAEALGKQEGDRQAWLNAGGTDAEWRQMEQAKTRRGTLGLSPQHVAIELPDGSQHMAVFSAGRYLDPDTGTPFVGAMPLQHTASSSLGAEREALISELYPGKKGVQISGPQMAHVNAVLMQRKGALTQKDALSTAGQMIPNASVDDKLKLAEGLLAGTAAPVAESPAAAPAAPAQAVTPPPTPGATPTAAPAGPTPPAAAPATPPKAPGLRDRVVGALPPGAADQSRETGKPVPASVQTAISRTESMNDNITAALAALEPYKNDTSLEGTMKLVEKYRSGTEGNPVALAAAQLPDLAGLQQSASSTLGGASRSQRIYADRRQHTPRLPSGRQIMFAHNVPGLNADRVSALSQIREGDEGGFDSPAQMYQKLVGLRDANAAFLRDIQQTATGVSPASSHEATPPPSPTNPAPASTPTAYQDASGKWIIRK